MQHNWWKSPFRVHTMHKASQFIFCIQCCMPTCSKAHIWSLVCNFITLLNKHSPGEIMKLPQTRSQLHVFFSTNLLMGNFNTLLCVPYKSHLVIRNIPYICIFQHVMHKAMEIVLGWFFEVVAIMLSDGSIH